MPNPKPIEVGARVRVVDTNHHKDPPRGEVFTVLSVDPDAVVLDYDGRRWPMLPHHVEVAS